MYVKKYWNQHWTHEPMVKTQKMTKYKTGSVGRGGGGGVLKSYDIPEPMVKFENRLSIEISREK
jgi:hypothetical protein